MVDGVEETYPMRCFSNFLCYYSLLFNIVAKDGRDVDNGYLFGLYRDIRFGGHSLAAWESERRARRFLCLSCRLRHDEGRGYVRNAYFSDIYMVSGSQAEAMKY